MAAIPPSEKDPAIRAEKHSIAKCARSAAVTGTIPLATFATVLLTKLYTDVTDVIELTAERHNWVCQSDAAPFPNLRKIADPGCMT
ncbi:MAG: hypothetical protein HN863_05815 [Marinovum sp.]|nr:hypothetical protein [Marinovum sp.]